MKELEFSDPNFIHKFRKLTLEEKKEVMERFDNEVDFIKINMYNKKLIAYKDFLEGV